MNRRGVWFALALTLSPCIASAKSFCIQLDDNGDVLVVKGGVKKGSKSVGGHYARFDGIINALPIYMFMPLAGSAILASDGRLVMGLTQYEIGISQSGNTSSSATTFHHVICSPGGDGKLDVADSCNDFTNEHPIATSDSRPGHVVECDFAGLVP